MTESNDPSAIGVDRHILSPVLSPSVKASESCVDILECEEDPSGIYTFEDTDDDDSMARRSSRTPNTFETATILSDLAAGETGALVSAEHSPTDERSNRASLQFHAKTANENTDSKLSLPTGQADAMLPDHSSDQKKTRKTAAPTSTRKAVLERGEDGQEFLLSVNVPDDGASMVSSLASDPSFMPWKRSHFLAVLNALNQGASVVPSQPGEEVLEQTEAASILGENYESIVRQMQNGERDTPIQSYRTAACQTTCPGENSVQYPTPSTKAAFEIDEEQGGAKLVEPSETTGGQHSMAKNTLAMKIVRKDRSDSGTSQEDSCSSGMSQKLKEYDTSESVLHSRGFRRLVCGFGILILLCTAMAIAGAVLIRRDSASSGQASVDTDTRFPVEMITPSATSASSPKTSGYIETEANALDLTSSASVPTFPETIETEASVSASSASPEASATAPDNESDSPTTDEDSPSDGLVTTDASPAANVSSTTSATPPYTGTDASDPSLLTTGTSSPTDPGIPSEGALTTGAFPTTYNHQVNNCEDDPDFSVMVGRTERGCQWLSIQSEEDKNTLCDPGEEAYRFRDACLVTCDNCPLPGI